MNRDYEVLGLKAGATQTEIKKAYFSLVRKHSPEKDPDGFRRIREAYEHLKNAQEEQGPVFAPPKEPWARRFLEQIGRYQKIGDDRLTRDACEEARRLFPDEIQFLYLQANAQRRAGNTGKAVKSCEELVEKEPENKWFWRELALSYQERGYTRKAFGAYARAYELGSRDIDFILDFSLSCDEYGQTDRGIQILTELVSRQRRWQRDEIPQVIEAYSGLVSMYIQKGENPAPLLKLFKDFLERYSVYIEENLDILSQIIAFLAFHPAFNIPENRSAIREMADVIKSVCRSEESKEIIKSFEEKSRIDWAFEDPRLGETMKSGIEAYFLLDEMESEIRTFAVLDLKLCMIEEREEILSQLDIIEREYPEYYEKFGNFAEQLREGKNLEYLKSSMLKQYTRLAQYVGGAVYFEKYPQEKARQMGTVVYENEQPYVRSGKKIGRNDPCPCGSGKKYKHCCMNK